MQKQWGDHLKMGEIEIPSRICMAALTRQRCNPEDGIVTDLVVEYYSQRANAGIILTEASAWSEKGQAFPGGANIYNQKQGDAWKKVVNAVHAKGGRIFLQIFHAGRATHPKITGHP